MIVAQAFLPVLLTKNLHRQECLCHFATVKTGALQAAGMTGKGAGLSRPDSDRARVTGTL